MRRQFKPGNKVEIIYYEGREARAPSEVGAAPCAWSDMFDYVVVMKSAWRGSERTYRSDGSYETNDRFDRLYARSAEVAIERAAHNLTAHIENAKRRLDHLRDQHDALVVLQHTPLIVPIDRTFAALMRRAERKEKKT